MRGALRRLARWEWPTLGLFVLVYVLWAGALWLPGRGGGGILAWAILIPVLTLHSSLTHEVLHGHPFRASAGGMVLGLLQPGLFVPYLRFKRLHLAHHDNAVLTDPYDDPESHYLDPAVWAGLPPWRQALLRFNNTIAGRMLVGPALGLWAFWRSDVARIRRGEWQVAADWALHLPGVAVVLWVVHLSQMPLWAYLAACYGAMSLLKIRTFLEHRAHEHAAGRTVIVEDRGLLALLFLNNNLHMVHHMHPDVPWYALPRLYRARKARYLQRNHGYVYRSYGEVFRRFLWRCKDPVAHPLWRPKG